MGGDDVVFSGAWLRRGVTIAGAWVDVGRMQEYLAVVVRVNRVFKE